MGSLISNLLSEHKASFVRVYDNKSESFHDFGSLESLAFKNLVITTFATPNDGLIRLQASIEKPEQAQGNSMGVTKGIYVVPNGHVVLGLFKDCDLGVKDRYVFVKKINAEILEWFNSN